MIRKNFWSLVLVGGLIFSAPSSASSGDNFWENMSMWLLGAGVLGSIALDGASISYAHKVEGADSNFVAVEALSGVGVGINALSVILAMVFAMEPPKLLGALVGCSILTLMTSSGSLGAAVTGKNKISDSGKTGEPLKNAEISVALTASAFGTHVLALLAGFGAHFARRPAN